MAAEYRYRKAVVDGAWWVVASWGTLGIVRRVNDGPYRKWYYTDTGSRRSYGLTRAAAVNAFLAGHWEEVA